MWDARYYAMCILEAASGRMTLESLRCAGHPSQAYLGLQALVQRLDLGSPLLLHAVDAALLALAALALARLLRRCFPAAALAPERALVVAALLVDPAVLSGVLHVNVDTGVFAFLACAAAAVVEDRRWLAAACGLLASFCKETGAVLYAALAAAWVLTTLLPDPVPRPLRNALLVAPVAGLAAVVALPSTLWGTPVAVVVCLAAALGAARLVHGRPWCGAELRATAARAVPLLPLLAPPALYAAYLAWRSLLPQEGALWVGATGGDVIGALLVPQVGPIARTYLALLFVVNFHWLAAAPVAADLLVGARRLARGAPARAVPGAAHQPLLFLGVFCALAVYLVTRFQTLVMARYMVPVYPYVFAVALAALLRLGVPAAPRRAALGALVALLAWSGPRTVDPVSRALFGTYRVGRHELLWINSFAGTCCGHGLNQAIYNLEFLRFEQLMQRALDRLHPARERMLVLPGPADWLSIGPLDRGSQRRLWCADAAIPPVLRAQDLADGLARVDDAWFVEVAYFPSEEERARLADRYVVGAPDSLFVDGYGIGIRRLRERVDTVASTARSPATGQPPRDARLHLP
jgi:hypothetical protein